MSGKKQIELRNSMNLTFDFKLSRLNSFTIRKRRHKIQGYIRPSTKTDLSLSKAAKSSNLKPSNEILPARKNQTGNNVIEDPSQYFKDLTKIVNRQKLILKIIQCKETFKMNLCVAFTDTECFVNIIEIFARVNETQSEGGRKEVLSMFFNEIFIENLQDVIKYLSKTAKHDKLMRYFWKNPHNFFENLAKIVKQSLQDDFNKPWLTHKILKCINETLPVFESKHNLQIKVQVKQDFLELVKLFTKFEDCEKECNKKSVIVTKEFPENFRNIPILLFPKELSGVFIPLEYNNTDKPYDSVNHYLETHFKLMREDFIKPLREGVRKFLNNPKENSSNKLRIYENVKFLREECCSNENRCVRVSLNLSKATMEHILQHSQSFKHGHLLCFSDNNFKDMIFGTIYFYSRDNSEILKNSELIVEFRDNDVDIDFNSAYTLVVYQFFSGPQFQLLNTLKNIQESDFPLINYIINLDTNIMKPQYFRRKTPNGYKLTISNYEIIPHEWPDDLDFHNFNASQLEAFQRVLTQELVLIEGPPATGKTYLGVKIVETLIDNKKFWYNNSPILILCKSKQSLDRFLKGVVKCTKSVIRVAGESPTPHLESYNLKSKLRGSENLTLREKREKNWIVLKDIKDTRTELEMINKQRSHGILKFNVFSELSGTWFSKRNSREIFDWLFVECSGGEISNKDFKALKEFLDDFKIANDETVVDNIITSFHSIKTAIENLGEISSSNKGKFFKLLRSFNYLHIKLSSLDSQSIFEKPKKTNMKNPLKMPPCDRWVLYFYFLNNHKITLNERLTQLGSELRSNYKILERFNSREKSLILQNSLVVGMTISQSIQSRHLLQSMKSPIVIVEDASEILEAHLITSLTKHCQHLIMIGDTKQLKPRTNDYSLNKTHHLDVSLFERLIMNGVPCCKLTTQYRMSPEISALVKIIYPNLKNCSTVNARESVRGVAKNVYFVSHTKSEASDGTSKKNYHEVDFFIAFAKYLVSNGYRSEKIAILAPYLGQVLEFEKEKAKIPDLSNVRVSTLDNFQGEESKVILVSLVRNNSKNEIGFLWESSRISLLLSRAKIGLYIMGNMIQLSQNSDIWCKIEANLCENECINVTLPLICRKHGGEPVHIRSQQGFWDFVRRNGCNINCDKAKGVGENRAKKA